MPSGARVAIVSGDFVPGGGMDRANLALASFLARNGRGVDVIAHRIAPLLGDLQGVQFHRVPKPFGSYFLGSPLLDRAGRRVGAGVLARGGRVVVNGGNCSVSDVNWVHYVHAAFAAGHGPSGWRAAKRGLERRVALRQERTRLCAARLVLANSERTKRDLLRLVGVCAERVRVIHLGVDADEFRPLSDAERASRRRALGIGDGPVLVFIGALGDSRKGFDTLLDAWATLERKGWDARLLVIGAGSELGAWKHRVAAAGWAESMRFLGFRPDVARFLPALDGIVAPVRYEPFGQAVHEALCCGLPAIVSSSAGVSEKIPDGLRGLLVDDPESSAELCARLETWRAGLGQHREAARSLSDVLRQRSWDVMAAEIYQAMEG